MPGTDNRASRQGRLIPWLGLCEYRPFLKSTDQLWSVEMLGQDGRMSAFYAFALAERRWVTGVTDQDSIRLVCAAPWQPFAARN